MREWLDPIPDGDTERIKELLFTKHPAYAEHPAVSKEVLIKAIEEKRRQV